MRYYNNKKTRDQSETQRKKASYRNTERYSVIIGEEEREGEGDVLAGD